MISSKRLNLEEIHTLRRRISLCDERLSTCDDEDDVISEVVKLEQNEFLFLPNMGLCDGDLSLHELRKLMSM